MYFLAKILVILLLFCIKNVDLMATIATYYILLGHHFITDKADKDLCYVKITVQRGYLSDFSPWSYDLRP